MSIKRDRRSIGARRASLPDKVKPGPKPHLSPRDVRVLDEYFCNGFNKTAAVESQGYAHPNQYATQFFMRPVIVAEIKRRQDNISKTYELDQEWVLTRLMKLADADLAGIMMKLQDSGYNLAVLSDAERFAVAQIVDETAVLGKGATVRREVKVKLESKLTALVTLAKAAGLLVEHHKVEVNIADTLMAARDRVAQRKRETIDVEYTDVTPTERE